MSTDGEIAAVILAAGASTRMGRPKPLLEMNGETFLDRLIALFSAFCRPVIVVLGEGADAVLAGIDRASQVDVAVNPAPDRGMLSSLRCGFERVPPSAAAVLLTPVDYPAIQRHTIELLVHSKAEIAIPVYDDRRGHPVRISRAIMEEILSLALDAKASDAIHRHASATALIHVDDPGVVNDIDTPDDYKELLAAQGRQP